MIYDWEGEWMRFMYLAEGVTELGDDPIFDRGMASPLFSSVWNCVALRPYDSISGRKQSIAKL